jgi:hypothetical protein
MHRLRSGNPQTGPIFRNAAGKAPALTSEVNRVILPALNRCEECRKAEGDHKPTHEYKRDPRIPESHGWLAARRGLGSNLYRLGVPDMVIQRILIHANVSTTATYYIKTAADDVRDANTKLENVISMTPKQEENTCGFGDSNASGHRRDNQPRLNHGTRYCELSSESMLSDWDCKNLAERAVSC